MNAELVEPLWRPSTERADATRLTAFRRFVHGAGGVDLADSAATHRYSCEQPGAFWRLLWQFSGLVGDPGGIDLLNPSIERAEFFPDGSVDVAATMLAGPADDVVLITCDESGTTARWKRAELRQRVASLTALLRTLGVEPGDVVAGYSTTSEPTATLMLAAAACGAVYTTTSAEFGVDAVVSRFGQVHPKVLLATDRYRFAGRDFQVTQRVVEIVTAINSIEAVITIESGSIDPTELSTVAGRSVAVHAYSAAVADEDATLTTTSVPFNAPGWILYSSGTTGTPKCIVHRAGGVLLKHLSEFLLHCDIRPNDRVFYYTTPSWMMWNWLLSGLAAKACVVLYDGSPLVPEPDQLLRMAARERVTYFGTSPSFLDATRLADVGIESIDLEAVRTIGVTGAPLSPIAARYAASWAADVHVLSKSGGTDLCGGLVSGDPTRPVWAGEIQAPAFGCEIVVLGDDGNEVPHGETGELVCSTPFPSQPIAFVGDTDRSRLRAAYYDRFPGFWHQSDFVSRTAHDGYVIHGRSDTTLNVHGVRIGTAEIYSQLERFDWVRSSVAFEARTDAGSRLALLVEPVTGEQLTEARTLLVKRTLRERCSPRHVPGIIVATDDLPRTMNGKVSEIAARDAFNAQPARGLEALSNPESLEQIRAAGRSLRDA